MFHMSAVLTVQKVWLKAQRMGFTNLIGVLNQTQELNVSSGGEGAADPIVPNSCEFGSIYGDNSFVNSRAYSGVLSFPQV